MAELLRAEADCYTAETHLEVASLEKVTGCLQKHMPKHRCGLGGLHGQKVQEYNTCQP